ncbi:MAG: Do family serine endopeptidase [Pseudomonadota bacterium]|uniref:Do family serine endopeptidase n=1 Tax=Candidatus Desulfatibia profunda TaxID=2841695 RepID=A0A8J6TMR7_9BACT|nr:Do family serine endopeptidase [Candidatus Desulfatibia profunda]MBL7180003.1 Do family serine endopeptidase [Desulfobacterales bacterium]
MLLHRFTLKNSFFLLAMIAILWLAAPSCGRCDDDPRETPVVKAARKVSPVVVNISSEYEVRQRVNPFSGFGLDPSLESFFKDFFDPGYEQRYQKASLGSGVIIDGKRGFVLTNNHVIQKTATITVILKDGREFKAQIVGADPQSDLAVLQISSKEPLPDIKMGNSDDLMVGETVFAIGNPFGFSNTVTTGVISATNRSIRSEDMVYQDFIQTDASINPGNSGGPLLNINGELIGINTAIYAKAQGIGFAIPINKAKRIVADLIKFGEVVQAWIGITVQNVDLQLSQYLKLPDVKGVLVKKVEPSSPANKAAVQEGDVIVSVGKRIILSENDYQAAIKDCAAGQTVDITVWRNGDTRSVSVHTTVFPLEQAMALAYDLIGVSVENLSAKNRYIYQSVAEEGVLITEIHRQSYLARIGVRPGDVIRKIDEITIKNVADFKKAVVKYRLKPSVVILLQRGRQLYNIGVKR